MVKLLESVLLFCATFYVVCAKHEQYEGHSLYEVIVKNAEQTKFLHELESYFPIQVFVHGHTERPGQILVSKERKAHFEELLSSMDVEYSIKSHNIREQLELEDRLMANAASKSRNRSSSRMEALSYDVIHRYQVVDDYLVRLGNAYPNLVKVESAGSSLLGRDVKYLKISTTNFEDRRKPVIFLMSLLHAREWVTLPATLYAIEKLVIDVTDSDLINDMDWIIMPIANPDGYEHSHDDDRFWRKNRRDGINLCMGVDLNRNFDVWWGTASSSNLCSDEYHGTGPFSEPETQNIKRILDEHADRIELFIDIHSFGSMVLFGYGIGELSPNALSLAVVGVNMAQAIDRVKWPSKPNYVVGNIFHVLGYRASGGSCDYAHVEAGIPLSYTFELPAFNGDTGLFGFFVDPDFIEQAGFETFEGIKSGARFVRDMLSMRKDAK
ncbi:carboxypeptidase B-like [Ostrinia furnacalis]|uniref:carboxypeptidase B-like n=1 Tax=Ostrinia furnacalis TaxID=93504 RepID=UPI001038F4EA|nr:carboxypeptidase B-like [Ostrinia furnacalis]